MSVSSATSSSSSTTSSTSSTSATTDPANIDWSELVSEMVAAYTAQADSIETELTDNETKISTYQQMQTLLSSLESAAQVLADPSNPSTSSNNVFLARSATLTSSGDVSASAVLGVTLDNGAATGSHTLTVSQLAEAEKVGSATAASDTTALGYSGVFSLAAADGTAVDISIDSSMSLTDVVNAINDETETTGVQASIVEVSSSEYELVMTTSTTNQAITASSVSGDDVLSDLGITDSSGNFTNMLQTAQAAVFTLDGIEITRDTNDISDVLNGVSFDLYSTTPSGTSITMDVGVDTDAIETALESLVDAYNSYRDFAIEQEATDSTTGTALSTAILFGDGTLRDVNEELADALNTTVGGVSMSSLGLSFNSSDELELDSSTLESTLGSDLAGVESLLGFSATTSSSDLSVVLHGSDAPSDFTLDLTVDGSGNLISASVDGDSSLFTIEGSEIIGNSGTAYAGFTFSFSGTTSESVDVSLSYGIASLLYNAADQASDTTTGTVQTIISGLEDTDTTLQNRIDDIDSAAEIYQSELTARYAEYEEQISEAETTQQYLTALLDSSSSSSS
ncbi:MAG TPA: flagellar filament capping protein FliD [Bradyrhizobium sp.]|nr:flagellar filament capping protein FliD [Bradyrhizobium sp.]